LTSAVNLFHFKAYNFYTITLFVQLASRYLSPYDHVMALPQAADCAICLQLLNLKTGIYTNIYMFLALHWSFCKKRKGERKGNRVFVMWLAL